MANASEVRSKMSQSPFLKGSDLGINKKVKVVISQVEEGVQKDNESIPQLMLHFEGREKKFSLNVGNLDAMISLYGEQTDDWVGKEINLRTVSANKPNGEPTIGIRIEGNVEEIQDAPF